MNLWWTIVGIASAVTDSALATPPRRGAIVGVELVGIFAFFALQRIAGAGTLWRDEDMRQKVLCASRS